MDNTIQELRRDLFETLQAVKENRMPLDQAGMIVQVAQAIINSAKVEVEFVKAINATQGSGFIPVSGSKQIS